MAKHIFTVVCDYAGGTYVSQFEGTDPVQVARQWIAMLRSEKPIPRSSGRIANSLNRDLDNGLLPVALDGLENVWQSGDLVARYYYTATFVQSR